VQHFGCMRAHPRALASRENNGQAPSGWEGVGSLRGA